MNLSAILSRLNGSVWFMTEDSLKVLLSIVESRVNGNTRTDEEVRALLQAAQMSSDRQQGRRQHEGYRYPAVVWADLPQGQSYDGNERCNFTGTVQV